MTVLTLPRDPPGEGGAKNKIKNHFKHSQALGGNFQFVEDRKSVILGVWAAPGAPETLPKGGGRSPPPFARVFGGRSNTLGFDLALSGL